jgi:hypothetical protein
MNNHTPHVECQQERQEYGGPDKLDAKRRVLFDVTSAQGNRSLLVAWRLPNRNSRAV